MNTTVQLSTPTPTLSVTKHFVTDRQTDRQYHAISRSYYVITKEREGNEEKEMKGKQKSSQT